MPATFDLEQRIGDLVAQAHPCENTTCDIPAMLARAQWALAARTLLNATDIPAGDPLAGTECTPQQPCGHCLPCAWDSWAASLGDPTTVAEFLDTEQEEWADWAGSHCATCPHCTTTIYIDESLKPGNVLVCGNCASTVTVSLALTTGQP